MSAKCFLASSIVIVTLGFPLCFVELYYFPYQPYYLRYDSYHIPYAHTPHHINKNFLPDIGTLGEG